MTKYLDENGLLYLWGKLKATFLHNATEGRFTGVSTNTNTGLRTFNVPTIAEHIYYDSNKNSTLKDKIDTIVSQGGEPNTIETVKVNGTALVPDANKAVNITFTDNDTKNTAGATNFSQSGSNLYLIGALAQTANPQTYSNSDVYIDSMGGHLYARTLVASEGTRLGDYAEGTLIRLSDGEINGVSVPPRIGVEDANDFSWIVINNGNTSLQSALNAKAPLASPALTGTPTAPTAAAGTNTTQIATTSFVNTAITNALGNFTGVSYEVVQALPASGAAGTIYLISNSGTNPNIYDEYIYVNNGFEKIGTTDVDLTNYWSKTELVVIPNTTIDYIVTNHALPS